MSDSVMTKRTTTVHTRPFMGPHPANAARHEKFVEMYRAGKTNGHGESFHESQCNDIIDKVVLQTMHRYWVDQAAAQEWIDFMVALNQRYDQGLTETTIQDI